MAEIHWAWYHTTERVICQGVKKYSVDKMHNPMPWKELKKIATYNTLSQIQWKGLLVEELKKECSDNDYNTGKD